MRRFTGKAFVYGKNVDTDQIYPGRYLDLTDAPDVAKHAMEGGEDPDFAKDFKPGDIIVAGTNFGCGSSREHAAITLKTAGVSAVIAESFARIFYRNGINLGVPLLVSPGIAGNVARGDILEVDLEKSELVNRTKNRAFQIEPVTDYAKNILEAGGIKSLLKSEDVG